MANSSQRGYNQQPALKPKDNLEAGILGYKSSHVASVSGFENESTKTAFIYNQAGAGYSLYADGKLNQLFDFSGVHSYADRCLWQQIEKELINLRETGATTVKILDAGCGPGVWLRRIIIRASDLGFTKIEARGFDIAREQVRRARFLSKDLELISGVSVKYDTADLTKTLPEQDASMDITICLYSVLCHIPVSDLAGVVAELARVTRGAIITTVRPTKSLPTVFVESIDKATNFKNCQDSSSLEVSLNDGRRFTLDVHLFEAKELKELFSKHFAITNMVGLDLFHSRFSPDPRWASQKPEKETMFLEHMLRLEEVFAADQDFLEYATHLLLVGKKRSEIRSH